MVLRLQGAVLQEAGARVEPLIDVAGVGGNAVGIAGEGRIEPGQGSARLIGIDALDLPSADESVNQTIGAREQGLALSKRKFVDPAGDKTVRVILQRKAAPRL